MNLTIANFRVFTFYFVSRRDDAKNASRQGFRLQFGGKV